MATSNAKFNKKEREEEAHHKFNLPFVNDRDGRWVMVMVIVIVVVVVWKRWVEGHFEGSALVQPIVPYASNGQRPRLALGNTGCRRDRVQVENKDHLKEVEC